MLGDRDQQARRVKVVGYDGSPRGRDVVRGAVGRARPGDRLIIVRALEDPADTRDRPAQYLAALHDMQTTLAPETLEGIDHELRVVIGRPAEALIEAALRSNAVAIVIGARRAPLRIRRGTVRAALEAGPVPVVALYGLPDESGLTVPSPLTTRAPQPQNAAP